MEKELKFQNLFYAAVLASFVGITPLEDLGRKRKVLVSGNSKYTFDTELIF